MNRREALGSAFGVALAASVGALASAAAPVKRKYPHSFLWGVAGAGHQIEGNNVNSDIWFLEHVKPTVFPEPSGDACDHYHRYRDDIALVKALGFNTLRMSIEWARIEPAPGEFSRTELEHYRRVLATCQEHGIKPFVTFSHFSTPRWFAADGGWENPRSPELFVRYCERAAQHLGDLMHASATFNEPNLGLLLNWILPPPVHEAMGAMLSAAARATGTPRFSSFQMGRTCWPLTGRRSRQSRRRMRMPRAAPRLRWSTTRLSARGASAIASARRSMMRGFTQRAPMTMWQSRHTRDS
jgi:beta-glucosidase